MTGTVSFALAMVLCVGAVAVLIPFYRARHDQVLQFLTIVVLLTALPRIVPIEMTRSSGLATLVFNIVGVAAGYYSICFFRAALRRDHLRNRRPRFRGERTIALSVGVVATTAWALAPAPMRSDLSSPGNLPHPAALVFDVVIIGYLLAVAGRAAWWSGSLLVSVRSAPGRRGDGDRPSAAGVRGGLLVGVAIIGAAELMRFVADAAKFVQVWLIVVDPAVASVGDALRVYIDLFIRTSKIVFLIGVLLPLVVDAARTLSMSRARRRDYTALEPLWRDLVSTFPSVELRGARSVYSRYYRRDVEIRDCMVLLEGYYEGHVADHARNSVSRGGDVEAVVVAELIRSAVAAFREGRPAVDPRPLPVSGAESRDQDAAWLVRVACAFSHPLLRPVGG